jgi:hypothetical protein
MKPPIIMLYMYNQKLLCAQAIQSETSRNLTSSCRNTPLPSMQTDQLTCSTSTRSERQEALVPSSCPATPVPPSLRPKKLLMDWPLHAAKCCVLCMQATHGVASACSQVLRVVYAGWLLMGWLLCTVKCVCLWVHFCAPPRELSLHVNPKGLGLNPKIIHAGRCCLYGIEGKRQI